jgi:hypothetical protein
LPNLSSQIFRINLGLKDFDFASFISKRNSLPTSGLSRRRMVFRVSQPGIGNSFDILHLLIERPFRFNRIFRACGYANFRCSILALEMA